MPWTVEAIAEGEKAVALAGEADSPTVEFRARIDLGLAYQHTAQPEKALTCYLAARAIETPPLDGSMEVNLASLYLELGRVREAMTEATAALEIAAPIGVPAGGDSEMPGPTRWQSGLPKRRACQN